MGRYPLAHHHRLIWWWWLIMCCSIGAVERVVMSKGCCVDLMLVLCSTKGPLSLLQSTAIYSSSHVPEETSTIVSAWPQHLVQGSGCVTHLRKRVFSCHACSQLCSTPCPFSCWTAEPFCSFTSPWRALVVFVREVCQARRLQYGGPPYPALHVHRGIRC